MTEYLPRIHELLDGLYTAREKKLFLASRQSLLNDEIPNDLIAAGRANEVYAMLKRFDEGAYI